MRGPPPPAKIIASTTTTSTIPKPASASPSCPLAVAMTAVYPRRAPTSSPVGTTYAAIVARSDERLRLHDVPGRQVLRPGPAGAREHLALVPAGGEDWRARAERRGQVDAVADHGRARGAVLRHRRARAGRVGRPAGAGAGARRVTRRARERRGRRPRAA